MRCETLYTGDYRGTRCREPRAGGRAAGRCRPLGAADLAAHAGAGDRAAAGRPDARCSRLPIASANATGALSAQQATNELLAFQAQQAMRLQALLVAESRADALERAREMEAQAQARAQHDAFLLGRTDSASRPAALELADSGP